MLESLILYLPRRPRRTQPKWFVPATMRYRPENDNGKKLPQGGESLPLSQHLETIICCIYY